jgi:hypothetical protein
MFDRLACFAIEQTSSGLAHTWSKELVNAPLTSKKYRLSTGPYCMLRLQEIVVSVAAVTIMVSHAVPKQKQEKHMWHSHLFSLNIDTYGSNLLGDF